MMCLKTTRLGDTIRRSLEILTRGICMVHSTIEDMAIEAIGRYAEDGEASSASL
jgi:hypothetical protein